MEYLANISLKHSIEKTVLQGLSAEILVNIYWCGSYILLAVYVVGQYAESVLS